MAKDNSQKMLLSLAYFAFGILWFVVGITSYLMPRAPFPQVSEIIWMAIFAIPLMLFSIQTFIVPKKIAKFPFYGSLLLMLSILLTYVFGQTHFFPRFVRWLAIALGVFVIAAYSISKKMSRRAIYGEIFGMAFVGMYFIVMIFSEIGIPHGGLAFIDGCLGLLYGVLLGAENL